MTKRAIPRTPTVWFSRVWRIPTMDEQEACATMRYIYGERPAADENEIDKPDVPWYSKS